MEGDLLFMPGLLCDARLWRAQMQVFPEATVADLTLDDHLDAMAHRALASMPERFALCALSMGGYAALALMRIAPERVTRLCLMDTTARPDTPAQADHRRGLMAITQGNRFRGVTQRLLPQLLHPDRLSDTVLSQEVVEMAARVGQAAFLRQLQAILGRPDSRPNLVEIEVPTMVAVGSHDTLTPPALAEEMAALIPGAVLRVIAAAGHLPPIEQPEAVNLLLREWLGLKRK